MRFPFEFFSYLVLGAVALAAAGALTLMVLFVVDTLRRRIW